MRDYEKELLEQYGMNMNSTRKIRGAVLCDTEQGVYLLKEVTASEQRMEALAELYQNLGKHEWCGIDYIVKNKDGTYISSCENGNKYILKKWFCGRECDVRKPGELLEASGMLAKLHLLMNRPMEHQVSCENSIEEEYNKHNQQLKKVRNFIRKQQRKNEFELKFLGSFDEMFCWAEHARGQLLNSGYQKLYEDSLEKHCFLHGEYNYHNILIDSTGNGKTMMAVTNFDKFKKGIQVEDFYYFLRKVMEKYGWKERLGDNMLNAYSAVKPLSTAESEYVKNRLAYPEKFWKITNAYYNTNKAWVSARNVEKLEMAIRQTREKERFLKSVFSFGI